MSQHSGSGDEFGHPFDERAIRGASGALRSASAREHDTDEDRADQDGDRAESNRRRIHPTRPQNKGRDRRAIAEERRETMSDEHARDFDVMCQARQHVRSPDPVDLRGRHDALEQRKPEISRDSARKRDGSEVLRDTERDADRAERDGRLEHGKLERASNGLVDDRCCRAREPHGGDRSRDAERSRAAKGQAIASQNGDDAIHGATLSYPSQLKWFEKRRARLSLPASLGISSAA